MKGFKYTQTAATLSTSPTNRDKVSVPKKKKKKSTKTSATNDQPVMMSAYQEEVMRNQALMIRQMEWIREEEAVMQRYKT